MIHSPWPPVEVVANPVVAFLISVCPLCPGGGVIVESVPDVVVVSHAVVQAITELYIY